MTDSQLLVVETANKAKTSASTLVYMQKNNQFIRIASGVAMLEAMCLAP